MQILHMRLAWAVLLLAPISAFGSSDCCRRPAIGLATNRDGSVIATATSPNQPPTGMSWQTNLMAFRRGASGWDAEPAFTYLGKARGLQPGCSDWFGAAFAVSDDGRFIAVGDPLNRYAGMGALHTPVTTSTVQSGAVFVFERKPSSWALRTLLKPNVSHEGARFGDAVAFGDVNRVLAVGSIGNSSNARDVDGDQADTSAPDSGAVWLY